MPWISVIGAVAGGLLSSGASSDAADAQVAAADKAAEVNKYTYDTTRADQAPFRDAGVAANNRLAMLLGLSPQSSQGATPGGSFVSADALRAQLLPQFTTGAVAPSSGYSDVGPNESRYYNLPGSPGTVDEAGLQAEIQRRMAAQQSQAQPLAGSANPEFGSLSRSFQASDMNADPVYQSGLQFGLNEGVKGINRQAAAGGSFLSGATLKALTRFGNDYGSTKANESYNRFNNNQDRTYNKLAGLSGAGQQATNQIGVAGQNMANGVSQSAYGAGDARASGYVGQAKAWNNALSTGVNAIQQNNALANQGSMYPSSWQTPTFGSGAAWSYDK